jgi:putative colanic acid biosysnthesis UDP-glucose lipid carrier transferase
MQTSSLKFPGDYASTFLPLQQVLDPILVVFLLPALSHIYGVPFTAPYILLATITFLLISSSFKLLGVYRACRGKAFVGQSSRILLGWGLVLTVLLGLGYLTETTQQFSQRLLLTWSLLVPVTLYFLHLNLQMLLFQLRAAGHNQRTAVIAGVSGVGLDLAEQIHKSPELNLNLLGFFKQSDDSEDGEAPQHLLLGNLKNLPEYVRQHCVDVVYIALPIKHEAMATSLITELQDTTACVYFVPHVSMLSLMRTRTHEINGIPLIAAWTIPFSGIQYVLKRSIDIVVASLAIALLSPVMIVIAIAVKLSSPGAILFKQRRYGLNGQEIIVYKFRTMTVMEDGNQIVQAKQGDNRITQVGAFLRRTSLDELPQFFNVIQGRMSIVGPRPHAVFHNEQYRKLINGYMLRHKVKPGITGLAQVNGFRGETDTLEKMQKRVEYDLHYLKTWSLGLDLSIILRTAFVFFHHRNAY